MSKPGEIEFPTWSGELGWEVMTWIPRCRKESRDHDRVVVSSFPEMAPLYADFATEFRPNDAAGRSLDYPKVYRQVGEHKWYGAPNPEYDIIIHARGIRRKANINYLRWTEVASQLSPLKVGCVGTAADQVVDGCWDLRGIEIGELCDYMAGCRMVVGVSAGVMHLAASCGANLVVWGDRRTYFGETLERRYKHTWNPFDVPVGWIYSDNWQPKPTEILKEIERLLL